MNIYVGNLSAKTTEEELREAFESFGDVDSAKIIKDNLTGRSRGFGFVEMPNQEQAQAAITGLNGKELAARLLRLMKPSRVRAVEADRLEAGTVRVEARLAAAAVSVAAGTGAVAAAVADRAAAVAAAGAHTSSASSTKL